MSSYKERCVILASYLVENKSTVRAVAAKFGISKSTVHKDITQNLKKINQPLYNEVMAVLEQNKKERHLRGGEATKKKYKEAAIIQNFQG
ncbi:MAG: sporulation transcriptional regulator SpoIIID [Clostridia bacterium]|nr:sporulation transcriptional regulator SpoIIID [Clostridia bacterium]